MRTKMTLLAAAATAAVFLSTLTAAVADPDSKTPGPQPANEPSPVTLAEGLVGPLHVSAGRDGALTVSEEFASRLTRIDAQGTKSVLYSNPGWDVAGIAQQGSTTYLLESQGAGPEDQRPLAGHVRTIDGDGHQNTFGDFAAWKRAITPTATPATASATCRPSARRCCRPRSLPPTPAKWIPIPTD